MKYNKRMTFGLLLGATLMPATAQIYPLTENNWRNPEFVGRFLGSYGVNTALNPGITNEDKVLFESLVPLMQSNVPAAIQKLREIIKPETNAAFDYTLGNLYFQTRQLDGAVESYRAAIRKFPSFLRAYKNLGLILVQKGDFENSREMMIKAIELGGSDADMYGTLGFCYLNSGMHAAALDAYRMAMMFSPKSRDWRLGKVQCLMNLGEYKQAAQLLDGLIDEFPGDTSLVLLQANALVSSQETMEAAANLEIVRRMGKATGGTLVLMGDIYVNMGHPNLALPYYLEAVGDEKLDGERAIRVGRALVGRAAWTEAEAFLRKLDDDVSSRLSTEHQMEIMNLRASTAMGMGREGDAAEILGRVVDRDPLNGRALLLIAEYHWKNREHEQAEIYFNRAQKVESTRLDALVQNARMHVAIREYAKASRLLTEAQMVKPQQHVAEYLAKVEAAQRASQF
jgi:tetratricopeptide (TPR) repeat protein